MTGTVVSLTVTSDDTTTDGFPDASTTPQIHRVRPVSVQP